MSPMPSPPSELRIEFSSLHEASLRCNHCFLSSPNVPLEVDVRLETFVFKTAVMDDF